MCPYWMEIAKSPHEWIDPNGLPEGVIDKFCDPSDMRMPLVVTLADWFLCCYTGQVPEEHVFQFWLIPCGNAPIHLSKSQETSCE